MGNKELGIADPVYDALRIRSGQSIAPDLGGGSTGAGGLENKIYVWHADGSTIDLFEPTEAGLDSAIAAAATGDTIWLPSIPIAIAAQKTVPANVALRGISHKAILNFTGFSTAAIVLSANSVIQDFTLNHTDGRWFDASADGAKALRIHGTADYATVGIVTSPQPTEIWIGEATGIYWRTLAGNWSAVAALPDADRIRWFGITRDGSTAYAATHPAIYADVDFSKLYKCTNPKAGSPTWTLIAQAGTSAAGSTISQYFSYTLGPCVIDGLNLYTLAHLAVASDAWAYGVYNGSAWSWTRTTDFNTSSPVGCGRDMYGFSAANETIKDGSNNLLDSIPGVAGYEFYRSLSGTRYLTRRYGSTLYVRQIGGAELATLGSSSFDNEVIYTTISGAENGNQVQVVSDANGAVGHLWVSDNGASFTDVATWQAGFARDEAYNGGGTLIWLRRTCGGSDEMIRRYARNGASNTDLTANFWSVASVASKTFRGLSLVYV